MVELEKIVNTEETQAEKKQNFVDELANILKNDERIASLCMEVIEEQWEKIKGEEHSNVDDTYQQLLHHFHKQKERVDYHVQGKQIKEDLLNEMEEMKTWDDFKNMTRILYDIKDEWEEAPYAGKEYDGTLERAFASLFQELLDAKDAYFANIDAARGNAKVTKEELVKKAKIAATSTRWKDTSKEMRELMEAWKAAGHAGRDVDDALWAEFNGARQEFFSAQDEFFKNREVLYGESKAKKDELIKEAQAICENEDIKETSIAMKELMKQWKASGSSGKANDDVQWQAFNAARDVFYKRQGAFYEARKGKFTDNLYEGIKRRNKQLADLEKIVKELQEQIHEIKNLEPVMGNQDNRWEITNERNQSIQKYQDSIDEYQQKMQALQSELEDMDKKYKNLTE
ncbi:MAG: DUF349 domain-containing protein [Breznakia sp.]